MHVNAYSVTFAAKGVRNLKHYDKVLHVIWTIG